MSPGVIPLGKEVRWAPVFAFLLALSPGLEVLSLSDFGTSSESWGSRLAGLGSSEAGSGSVPLAPAARNGHSMAYDDRSDAVVLFGGDLTRSLVTAFITVETGVPSDSDRTTYAPLWNNETWVYRLESAGWAELTPRLRPPKTSQAAMVYHSASEQFLLTGGHGMGIDGTLASWTYNPAGNVWSRLAIAEAPSHRWNHAMAYDPAGDRVVLFGGMTAHGPNNETWVYYLENETWSNRAPVNGPLARHGHRLVFDEIRERVVLFGGVGRSSIYSDMWVYDLDANSWSEVNQIGAPAPRFEHSMAYHRPSDRIFLFGSSGDVSPLGDL